MENKEKLKKLEETEKEPKIRHSEEENFFWGNYEEGWPYPDDEEKPENIAMYE
jgi:hypothetical protein|tara:strand:- start:8902 stop:9060 length:159 start_codon:yes stop_codon:yes gene_type:complete